MPNQLMLSIFNDVENFRTFRPKEHHARQLSRVLDPVVRWTGALRTLRVTAAFGQSWRAPRRPAPTRHDSALADRCATPSAC